MTCHAPTNILLGLYEFINLYIQCGEYTLHFVFITNIFAECKHCMFLAEKWKYLKQIFESLNYINKNVISGYFAREKAEKIGKKMSKSMIEI